MQVKFGSRKRQLGFRSRGTWSTSCGMPGKTTRTETRGRGARGATSIPPPKVGEIGWFYGREVAPMRLAEYIEYSSNRILAIRFANRTIRELTIRFVFVNSSIRTPLSIICAIIHPTTLGSAHSTKWKYRARCFWCRVCSAIFYYFSFSGRYRSLIERL